MIRPSSRRVSARPIKPVAPVIRIRIAEANYIAQPTAGIEIGYQALTA
jgi:hypothetical protein